MAKYVIRGGKTLRGTVKISGNKNAAFPCIAAALLSKEKVTIKNMPDIDDVAIMIEILNSLGVQTKFSKSTLEVNAANLNSHVLPNELMRKLRGSVVLVGSILARKGKVKFAFSGGDIVGKRSIETHLQGFRELGYHVKTSDLNYSISGKIKNTKKIFLKEASVTATENLILALVLGSQTVTLKNCATEPHVVDLSNMLVKMGAKIEGLSTSTLKIKGVQQLHGVSYHLGPDYLEMGTYAIATTITGGQVKLSNCSLEGLEPVRNSLAKMGILLAEKNNNVSVSAKNILSVSKLTTNIWPGFPTDLMSIFIVLATQAKGVSLLHDWMYESRMFFVDKLINMGANITIADPHRVFVYGPTKLMGRELESPDIRAGMALVLAALIARGKSTINKAELIDRGYEDVVGKLTSLGADIEKAD